MKINRVHIVQVVSLLIIQSLVLIVLAFTSPGITIHTFWSAVAIVLLVSVVESIVWWVFIEFFARLPIILYPLLTFFLTGAGIAFAGNYVPGITIDGIFPAIWIAIFLTVVNAILGGIFSLDEDSSFDRSVTRKMVEKYGNPEKTDKPGTLFLEIDGLSIDTLKMALEKGLMPTLKKWIDSQSHKLISWETDFSSQTGAMQAGILLGSNLNIPAYRWWDRKSGKTVMSGNPFDAQTIESTISKADGILANGGSSRGNMFSGDATESLFTISALLNNSRKKGPGFYFYLINPFIIARLISRFFIEVVKEWYQAYAQKVRHDKYVVSARNPAYAFLRAFMGPFLQDLTTYTVISDLMRGVPAVYALYAGYDDLGHFAGMRSPEAFEKLAETDRYFARIEAAIKYAPRPYNIIVLSDHGQSEGPTFETANGMSLQKLISLLVSEEVFARVNTNEAWDNLNAVLSESIKGSNNSAKVVKKTLLSKIKDGVVQIGPDRDIKDIGLDKKLENEANVIIFASGCTGLIYIKNSKNRLTYEDLQKKYPNLISGLIAHKGIGFIVVKSENKKTMVIGSGGINFVDSGKIEGEDPLKDYGPNAKLHIKVESSFENCPDIIVGTKFDPSTEELAGFENQVSHHGGLGGPQNRPFILFPSNLKFDGKPIVGASEVYKQLLKWRNDVK